MALSGKHEGHGDDGGAVVQGPANQEVNHGTLLLVEHFVSPCAQSALRADSLNIHPYLRGRLAGRVMHTYRV